MIALQADNERALPGVPPEPERFSYAPGYGFVETDSGAGERSALYEVSTKLGFALVLYFLLSLGATALAARLIYPLLFTLLVTAGRYTPALGIAVLTAGEIALRCLSLGFPFLLYKKQLPKRQGVRTLLRRRSDGPAPGVLTAIAISGGVLAVANGAVLLMHAGFSLFRINLLYPTYTASASLPLILAGAVKAVLLPAVLEEIVFRGVVLQSLRPFGDGFALAVSSLVFALAHGNFLQLPFAFLLGLCFGYFTLYFGTLRIAIAMHLFVNASVFLLDVAAYLGGPALREAVSIAIPFLYLAAGALALARFCRHDPAAFTFTRRLSTLRLRVKLSTFFLSPAFVTALMVVASVSAGYVRFG